ncbi:V-type ATP synthase subunit D [Mangrovibacterium sp.]|uniref:V-type ATP synthase subunit D n=1 Tax=Mangrovibacterium sp. TaxID=1961364 RepID=UPI003567FED4
MKLQIKYNKTVLREFQKKLTIRQKALPTLKNKEAALRAMVFETRRELEMATADYQLVLEKTDPWKVLWNEFDFSLLKVLQIKVSRSKVAGIMIPRFEGVETRRMDFALTAVPDWFSDGMPEMQTLLEAMAKCRVQKERLSLLEDARKKATQKVNLYEKVQIPSLEGAIRQIKRYLEDEDNLSKAAQKLLKTKKQKTEQL